MNPVLVCFHKMIKKALGHFIKAKKLFTTAIHELKETVGLLKASYHERNRGIKETLEAYEYLRCNCKCDPSCALPPYCDKYMREIVKISKEIVELQEDGEKLAKMALKKLEKANCLSEEAEVLVKKYLECVHSNCGHK